MLNGYKTVMFNVVAIVIPLADMADVTHLLNPRDASIYGFVVAMANIILRFYTTSPIFNKVSNVSHT